MRKPYFSCIAVLALSGISFGQAPKPTSPEIEKKVDAILSKMTLDQKVDMLGGINFFDVRGFPELGLPVLHTADGPVGVRNDGPATTMAGGISLASTWDTVLAQQVGEQIGRDARAKGKHFMLGPGLTFIARHLMAATLSISAKTRSSARGSRSVISKACRARAWAPL